jgi:hypothetical protein
MQRKLNKQPKNKKTSSRSLPWETAYFGIKQQLFTHINYQEGG